MDEPTFTTFSSMIWGVLPSLDRGIVVPMADTVDGLADHTIAQWLGSKLDDDGRLDLSIVSPAAWQAFLTWFDDQHVPPRELSVGKNGLSHLIALSLEGLQQLRPRH